MAIVKYLAVLPFLGILVGVPLLNRVEPLVFGMPLILAWIVAWIILSAAIMAIIYRCDPANHDPADASR
jgi:xanthosine utilization system XapX-like protein